MRVVMLAPMRMLWLAMLVACSGSQHGGSGGTNDLGCKVDTAARAACDAKGSGHVYMAEPDFGCSGVELPPEEQRRVDAEARARPCRCMSDAEYTQRQHSCETMP